MLSDILTNILRSDPKKVFWVGRFAVFAKDAFYGGRNESVCIGFIEHVLYDVDLSGAYSIAMTHVPRLDFTRTVTVDDVNAFNSVDVAGFAEVCFEFPVTTRFPCLPV